MSQTQLERLHERAGAKAGRWMTVIYNNDVNTFDEVIAAIMEATGCDLQEAAIEAWEAHHYGKAPVHFASYGECDVAAAVIASIGVRTEVVEEWLE
jgi:ATP-dependent Clp protease adapter protein ClpS